MWTRLLVPRFFLLEPVVFLVFWSVMGQIWQRNSLACVVYRYNTIQIKLGWALFVTYTIIQSIMRSEMCSLHLTHPSVHTWSSRGLPVGAGIRTHNLGLPRVSSPTLYPLGQRLPRSHIHRSHCGKLCSVELPMKDNVSGYLHNPCSLSREWDVSPLPSSSCCRHASSTGKSER